MGETVVTSVVVAVVTVVTVVFVLVTRVKLTAFVSRTGVGGGVVEVGKGVSLVHGVGMLMDTVEVLDDVVVGVVKSRLKLMALVTTGNVVVVVVVVVVVGTGVVGGSVRLIFLVMTGNVVVVDVVVVVVGVGVIQLIETVLVMKLKTVLVEIITVVDINDTVIDTVLVTGG